MIVNPQEVSYDDFFVFIEKKLIDINRRKMPLSNKIEITNSSVHGKTWRAKELIKEGESLWTAGEYDNNEDYVFDLDTIKSWDKEKQDRFWSLAYHFYIVYIILNTENNQGKKSI